MVFSKDEMLREVVLGSIMLLLSCVILGLAPFNISNFIVFALFKCIAFLLLFTGTNASYITLFFVCSVLDAYSGSWIGVTFVVFVFSRSIVDIVSQNATRLGFDMQMRVLCAMFGGISILFSSCLSFFCFGVQTSFSVMISEMFLMFIFGMPIASFVYRVRGWRL